MPLKIIHRINIIYVTIGRAVYQLLANSFFMTSNSSVTLLTWKLKVLFRIVCNPASLQEIFENNVISKTAVENPFVIEEHLEFSKSELEVQRVPFR